MSTLLRRTHGCNTKITTMALILILTFLALWVLPVSSETPMLRISGNDLAPGIIYLGGPHAEEMDNILMLQVSLNTTYSGGVTLSKVTFHRTGSYSDANVESVILYNDTDFNRELNLDKDTKVGSANFEVGRVEFPIQLTITPEKPLSLLVALSISSDSTMEGTIGIDIPNEDYIETQENADIEFYLCICSENSTIVLDTDGDLNPDTTDSDDDNDGYMDDTENLCGSDPKDSASTPKDTDEDYVPDSIDKDDDNDGVPDKYDDFPLDADRQRDYTMVSIYALIALVFIIVLILLVSLRKPKGLNQKKLSEEEDLDDEFDVDIEEEGEEGEEEENGIELEEDEDLD
ncbi:MAG: hypothetical protein JSW00_13710 [Thermoplasmata archaeon]|nr:MAG: hypothetical protein JSW00_13710 [Thermoplasmata archaeon]